MPRDLMWRLIHTHVWSKKRPAHTLRDLAGEYYAPLHWRRLISRPGWFIALVRYDKREKGA